MAKTKPELDKNKAHLANNNMSLQFSMFPILCLSLESFAFVQNMKHITNIQNY
jgi:hypothetical protein